MDRRAFLSRIGLGALGCSLASIDNETVARSTAATGVFEKGTELKKIRLGESVTGRYLRFVAKDGFDGKPYAAIAEIDIESDGP